MALCLVPSLASGSFARIARPTRLRRTIFLPLCGLRKAIGDSGESLNPGGEVHAPLFFIPWRAGDQESPAVMIPRCHTLMTRHAQELGPHVGID